MAEELDASDTDKLLTLNNNRFLAILILSLSSLLNDFNVLYKPQTTVSIIDKELKFMIMDQFFPSVKKNETKDNNFVKLDEENIPTTKLRKEGEKAGLKTLSTEQNTNAIIFICYYYYNMLNEKIKLGVLSFYKLLELYHSERLIMSDLNKPYTVIE